MNGSIRREKSIVNNKINKWNNNIFENYPTENVKKQRISCLEIRYSS